MPGASPSASPATGSHAQHEREQRAARRGRARPSELELAGRRSERQGSSDERRDPRADARRVGDRGDDRQMAEEGRRAGRRSTSRWSSSRPTRSASRCPRPSAGVLAEILVEDGSDVEVGAVIGRIEEGAGAAASPRRPKAGREGAGAGRGQRPARGGRRAGARDGAGRAQRPSGDGAAQAGPAARKLAAEKGIDLAEVPADRPQGQRHQGRRDRRPGRQGARRRRAAGAPPWSPHPAAEPAPAPRPARRPRGAGPDDPAPEADRRAAQGGAEHRRHADDLQRGRHERR